MLSPTELVAGLRALAEHRDAGNLSAMESALLRAAALYISGATDSLREHMTEVRRLRGAGDHFAGPGEMGEAGGRSDLAASAAPLEVPDDLAWYRRETAAARRVLWCLADEAGGRLVVRQATMARAIEPGATLMITLSADGMSQTIEARRASPYGFWLSARE